MKKHTKGPNDGVNRRLGLKKTCRGSKRSSPCCWRRRCGFDMSRGAGVVVVGRVEAAVVVVGVVVDVVIVVVVTVVVVAVVVMCDDGVSGTRIYTIKDSPNVMPC